MDDVKHNILDLFHNVKHVSDRIPTDFGGGSPLTKVFLMAYLAVEYKLRSYVEIGVYRGKSFFPMAYVAKLLDGKAYGIDAYDLETAKEYEVDPSFGDVNGFLAGLDFAQIFKDVKNLQEQLGLLDHSEIIKDDSKNAIRYFRENQIEIDMLHIDGNHDSQAVQADVDAYVPLVRDGGLIIIDDIDWESVMSVYRVLEQKYVAVFNDGFFAVLVKEQVGKPVRPITSLQLDAVYSLAALTAQIEEKNSILSRLQLKAEEHERSVNTLVAHTEDQGKVILAQTKMLAEIERRALNLDEQVHKKDLKIKDLSQKAAEDKNQVQTLIEQSRELRELLTAKEQQIGELQHFISALYQSTSWKLTRPVRAIKDLTMKVLDTPRGMIGEGTNRRFRPRKTTRDKKVSVVVTSYNHENYIEECIASILKQKGFFKIEIIVGDDCSTDGTARIIERYKKIHPKLITVLPCETNLGITKNLKRCLDACSGDYIAICEGDDYWLDQYKLQKQLEHLEDHPDQSMCFSGILFQFGDEKQYEPFEAQTRLKKEVITTADLIEDNYVGNFSCCMYRTQTVRNLPKEIFDVFTVDWMFNMACGDQGLIGFLPEPMSVYRKHSKGTWTGKSELEQVDNVLLLLDSYNKLLDGRYKDDFDKRKMHLYAYKKRLIELSNPSAAGGEVSNLAQRSPLTAGKELDLTLNWVYPVDLLILDTIFPHPLSPFRFQEFISYMDCFPSSLVLTTGDHLPAFKETRKIGEIIDVFEQEYPGYAGRAIASTHELDWYTAKLAYVIFLNNIYIFLDALEKKQIPFVFTLYPGGGFKLDESESDTKLTRVLGSPQFRKVIVSQKITYDYLLEKKFCSPEQIEFIYGVVTPLEILKDYDHKQWYGYEKGRLDICFVAHKYMDGGIDKGYDLFIESARQLASEIDDIHFHVIGDFSKADIPIDGLEDKLTFYGQREQSWFDNFYRNIDIILSPNRPFVLMPGTFDGFPTASCTEAGLRKVAIFCTDILKLNNKFTDKKDIVIINPDIYEIVETIKYYHDHPGELKAIAENGHLKIREVYSYENQIKPRIHVLEKELKSKD